MTQEDSEKKPAEVWTILNRGREHCAGDVMMLPESDGSARITCNKCPLEIMVKREASE